MTTTPREDREKTEATALQPGLQALKIVLWRATRERGRIMAQLLPPIPDEIAGLEGKARNWTENIHRTDRPVFAAWLAKIKSRSAAPTSIDYRLELEPGTLVWVRHWVRPPKKAPSRARAQTAEFSGLIQIIDEQKRAEAGALLAVENERLQLGQELHDETCQLLAGLACLTKALAAGDPVLDAKPLLKDLERELSVSLGRIRVRSHALVPTPSIEQGLAAALRKLAANTRLLYGVKITLGLPSQLHRHGEDRVVQLHGIAHESIANAIQHGHATSLHLALRSRGKNHVFEISDNGRGLRQNHRSSGGIGFYLMKYRAALIGAHVLIKNRRPRGTCVQVNYTVA